MPFVDGLWRGDIETASGSAVVTGCWASTRFDDGTTLRLVRRTDGSWHLRLSNPGWQLPQSNRYDMTALVDFYPKLNIRAEAVSPVRLEIAGLDRISLLGLIENGHTIHLAADGFDERYDLEGSAKIIQRLRTCFSG